MTKQKRKSHQLDHNYGKESQSEVKRSKTVQRATHKQQQKQQQVLSFDTKYILAPMVGASEPAFRILCRNYGTQLCYSPMLDVNQFINNPEFRQDCFPDCEKAPVVAHFGCNDPNQFAQAAKLCLQLPNVCMIDLNLGCPQRTAYLGHYGSYLLDEPQRICNIVSAAALATNYRLPVSVKIRLLSTPNETLHFCRQVAATHAVSLIAIHARHRASWQRKGPGARDGPALLDQVRTIRDALQDEFPNVMVVTNGNTLTWETVVSNLHTTRANGLMSAEGILDRPNLFVQRYSYDNNNNNNNDNNSNSNDTINGPQHHHQQQQQPTVTVSVLPKKVQKVLCKLWKLAKQSAQNKKASSSKQIKYEAKLDKLLPVTELERKPTTIAELQHADSIALCTEYLDLARAFPVPLRTAIFHVRRMLRIPLSEFQLMQETLQAENLHQLRILVARVQHYQTHPSAFTFDSQKAQAEKLAMERNKQAQGRRKQYEERMMRKAKREKKPLDYYLKMGAALPTPTFLAQLQQTVPRAAAMKLWKQSPHTQHCLAFHLDGVCQRQDTCAFLHLPLHGFEEGEEVAG